MKKKLIISVLAMSLLICNITPAIALNYSLPQTSLNFNANNYIGNWSRIVKSYLVDNHDNTLTRIECIGNNLIVEKYNSDFKFLNGFDVPMELDVFGGFYESKDYYFVVFGQNNNEEDPDKEVYRIVKYDKDFNRIDSASVYGGESCTKIPFDAGSLRMTEIDGNLVIHTCREMFKSEDGLNHQSNYTIFIKIDDMGKTIPNGQFGSALYTSHSFNQFILSDNDEIVTLDHGDAYPRAITLQKMYVNTSESFNGDKQEVSLVDIEGNIGDNYTGITIGGLEKSEDNYIAVGSAKDDYKQYRNGNSVSNIFISTISRDSMDKNDVEFKYITNYKQNSDIKIGTPYLSKLNDDLFVILWSENDGQFIKYAKIDGNGNVISDIKTYSGELSGCKPILFNNNLIWYTTHDSMPIFYKLNIENMTIDKISVDNSNVTLQNNKSDIVSVNNDDIILGNNKDNKSDSKSENNNENQSSSNIITGWKQEGRKWYYIDENGNKKTGWLQDNDKWYYLKSDGVMAAEQWILFTDTGIWYFFDSSGAMIYSTTDWSEVT